MGREVEVWHSRVMSGKLSKRREKGNKGKALNRLAGGRGRSQVRKRMNTILKPTRSHRRILTKEVTRRELHFTELHPVTVKDGMKWRRGKSSDRHGRLHTG